MTSLRRSWRHSMAYRLVAKAWARRKNRGMWLFLIRILGFKTVKIIQFNDGLAKFDVQSRGLWGRKPREAATRGDILGGKVNKTYLPLRDAVHGALKRRGGGGRDTGELLFFLWLPGRFSPIGQMMELLFTGEFIVLHPSKVEKTLGGCWAEPSVGKHPNFHGIKISM